MDLNKLELKEKITLAAVVAGAIGLATDAQALSLLPAPWGMLLSKFATYAMGGGILYNMRPQKEGDGK